MWCTSELYYWSCLFLITFSSLSFMSLIISVSAFSLSVLLLLVWFNFLFYHVFLAYYMLSTMVRRIQSISRVKGLREKWVSLPLLGKVT